MNDRLGTDEDDETFMRRITFAEEDRHRFTSTPWRRWIPLVPVGERRSDGTMAEKEKR